MRRSPAQAGFSRASVRVSAAIFVPISYQSCCSPQLAPRIGVAQEAVSRTPRCVDAQASPRSVSGGLRSLNETNHLVDLVAYCLPALVEQGQSGLLIGRRGVLVQPHGQIAIPVLLGRLPS